MVTNEESQIRRVVSTDLQEWVDAVNADDVVSRLNPADLDLDPTPENTAALLAALVDQPLPAEVLSRCTNPEDDAFRVGCFRLLRDAHDRGLRLRIVPLAGAVGEVRDSEPGFLDVSVGIGTTDPFG